MATASGSLCADTIVRKDGIRVPGQVKLCDDEVCVAGSTRVPRSDIAAILLGDAKMPLSGAAGTIVLKDGTTRRGHFDSLTLGFATLGGADIDRGDVAAIIVADIVPPKKDTIVLRDGTSRTGSITKCDAASCTIDGNLVPRDSTRWIALAQDGGPPATPSEDTVFLANGTSMAARLSGLDASQAQTTHGNVPRKDVTWIYVADAPAPAGNSGMVDITPPDAGSQPTTTTTGTSDSSQKPPNKSGDHHQPPPPPPTQPRPSNCRPGKLWTGRIKAHSWGDSDGIRFDLKIDAVVRAQETICDIYKYPERTTIASVSHFDVSGSTIDNHLTELGHNIDCKAEGSTAADPQSKAQAIYRSFSATSKPPFGFDVPNGRALYFFGLGTPAGSSMPMTCNGSPSSTSIIGPPLAGRNPLRPARPWETPDLQFLHDGKMIGSAVAAATTPFQRVAFSWAICPVGGECSLPPLPGESGPHPPPASSNDPCDELKSLIAQMKQLADAYKDYERDYKEAVGKRDGIRDEIWGGNGALRKFFTAFGELAGTTEVEGTRALKELLAVVSAAAGEELPETLRTAGFLKAEDLQEQAEEAAVEAATEHADKVLEETGSDSAALRAYADSVEHSELLTTLSNTIRRTADIAIGIKEYAETTSELAGLISEWLEENENANREQEGMNDVQTRMDELQEKIDEARNKLTGPCPGTSVGTLRPRAAEYAYASLPVDRAPAATPAPSSNAVPKLKDIRSHVDQASAHVRSSVEWLLPFIYREKMSPRLQKALLAKAQPDLAAAVQHIDAARQEASSIEADVRATVPPKATPAPGPGSHPSSYR